MKEPFWIAADTCAAIHRRVIDRFGGLDTGVHDENLFQAALARPLNKWHYDDPKPDLFVLASAYAFGLARNHAFVDGNKRIAFIAMRVFLLKNGVAFNPKPEHATSIILSLAAGEVSEESLTRWIRDNWPSE